MNELLDGVLDDVLAVPPDRDLLAMVERIIEAAHVPPGTTSAQMVLRLGIVQGTAERLKAALR
jgi:hypothetical protein